MTRLMGMTSLVRFGQPIRAYKDGDRMAMAAIGDGSLGKGQMPLVNWINLSLQAATERTPAVISDSQGQQA